MILNKKIYLPQFPGFYESFLGYLVEREEEFTIENEGLEDYDELTEKYDIDYKKTFEEISRDYYSLFKQDFGSDFEKELGIKLLGFDHLYSPQYYNYENDEIVMNVEIDTDKLISYLNANKEEFSKKIQKENTGYDGFTPWFDNDFNEYVNSDLESGKITQIIDFYLETIGFGGDSDTSEHVIDKLQGNGVVLYINEKE